MAEKNVIDELVVTLGLDASQFTKEQRRASESVATMRKTMEANARVMASAFRRIGLEFTGLFFGIRGVGDIIGKFADLNSTMAELGYTSRQLGESASNLRLYQQIAGGFGGTAAGVSQMVGSLEQGMFSLRYMGQMSGQMASWLRFAGGLPAVNAQGGIDVLAMVKQLREHLAGMPNVDKNQILTALGVSDGIRNAVMATRETYDRWVNSQRASARQMAQGARAAEGLQRAWRNLKYGVEGAAGSLLTALTPAIRSLLAELDRVTPAAIDKIAKWVRSHGPQVQTFFDELSATVKGLADSFEVIGRAARYLLVDPAKLIGHTAADIVTNASSHVRKAAVDRKEFATEVLPVAAQYGIPRQILARALYQRSLETRHPYMAYTTGAMDREARQLQQYHAAHGTYPGNLGSIAQHSAVAQFSAFARSLAPTQAQMGALGAVHIDTITINTRALDAKGIAADIQSELSRIANTFQADNGMS